MVKRSMTEIEAVHGNVVDQIGEGGTRFAGMSYEEGIDDFVRWLFGDSDGDGEWPFVDDGGES